MIDYLNNNDGFAIVVLTGVYVIATVVLVLVSQFQASLAKKSLDFASSAERARYRPYVVFDIVWEDNVAYARIRNSGASPALGVKVDVVPDLHWSDGWKVGFVEKGILYLSPQREISRPFNMGEAFFKDYPELKFSGSITYTDAEGHRYSEPFQIDLGYEECTAEIGRVDVGREIEKIRKIFENLQRGSFKPLVRVMDEANYQEHEAKLREDRRTSAQKRRTGEVHRSTEPTEGSPDQPQ